MDLLKLAALDEKDLEIISAHVQDAVMKVDDLTYRAAEKRFLVAMNRFVWEKKTGFFSKPGERRRAVLHFDRVVSVRTQSIDRARGEDVLSLLAIRFVATEPPAGIVELVFAGNASIRLEVECIEARLTDLGAAWDTRSRPVHGV